jgi:site-specific DNA-methyltransferase (adenine-specific)
MNSIAKKVDVLDGLQSLVPGSVACTVTSPPYNIGIKYSTHQDKRADYLEWLQAVFTEVKNVTMDNGHFFLQMGGTSVDPLIPQRVLGSALHAGWVLQNEIIWVKNISIGNNSYGHFKPINSGRFLNHTHEFIFHMTKTGKVPITRLAIGVPFVYESNIARWKGNNGNATRCRGNVWYIPYETVQSKKDKYYHPAIFPVALPEMCIKLAGIPKTSLVFDPFVGTGSTLVACEQLGMQGIGFDIDQKYIEAANNRLKSCILDTEKK